MLVFSQLFWAFQTHHPCQVLSGAYYPVLGWAVSPSGAPFGMDPAQSEAIFRVTSFPLTTTPHDIMLIFFSVFGPGRTHTSDADVYNDCLAAMNAVPRPAPVPNPHQRRGGDNGAGPAPHDDSD